MPAADWKISTIAVKTQKDKNSWTKGSLDRHKAKQDWKQRRYILRKKEQRTKQKAAKTKTEKSKGCERMSERNQNASKCLQMGGKRLGGKRVVRSIVEIQSQRRIHEQVPSGVSLRFNGVEKRVFRSYGRRWLPRKVMIRNWQKYGTSEMKCLLVLLSGPASKFGCLWSAVT